jgi:hypothetical protein
MRRLLPLFFLLILTAAGVAQDPATGTWTFAVSGDSRNCGNVVMPAIAAGVRKKDARFYWHLGDFRAIYKFDEDYLAEPAFARDHNEPLISNYLRDAWTDFITHQLVPFSGRPTYLALGNHETIPPKTHDDVLKAFKEWFDSPTLSAQRLSDNPLAKTPVAYYHWTVAGVDFFSLDNSAGYTFDEAQLNWFLAILRRDEGDAQIQTIVVGMHEALPDSIAAGHSMCSSADGIKSGRAVYRALVHAQQVAHKHVYVLASHSHFYLDNVYNSPFWNDPKNGGAVLPGWIVGTAGAERYKLPPGLPPGTNSAERQYGYLLGSVAPDHTITFSFIPIGEKEMNDANTVGYAPEFIHQCVVGNPLPEKMRVDDAQDPCKEKEK